MCSFKSFYDIIILVLWIFVEISRKSQCGLLDTLCVSELNNHNFRFFFFFFRLSAEIDNKVYDFSNSSHVDEIRQLLEKRTKKTPHILKTWEKRLTLIMKMKLKNVFSIQKQRNLARRQMTKKQRKTFM